MRNYWANGMCRGSPPCITTLKEFEELCDIVMAVIPACTESEKCPACAMDAISAEIARLSIELESIKNDWS